VHFRFVWVGRTRDRLLSELEEGYLKRLGHLIPTELTWVPELKKGNQGQLSARLEREARSLERKIKESYLVVLDEAGRQFASQELSATLEKLMNRGVPEVTFVVGGCWGIPEQIKRAADLKWSLGRLTLPHELARVVVLEQVYRSMSILRSLPYHK
jgi:23S rRNA (pseudouridine1915-N3)-methyltransferase